MMRKVHDFLYKNTRRSEYRIDTKMDGITKELFDCYRTRLHSRGKHSAALELFIIMIIYDLSINTPLNSSCISDNKISGGGMFFIITKVTHI